MNYPNKQQTLDPLYYMRWKKIMEHPDIKFFKWDDAKYLIIDPVEVKEAFLQALEEATEFCGRIYQKAVKFVLQDERLLYMLGIPAEAVDFCKLGYAVEMPVTAIGRFDFAVDGRGYLKLLEFNSDTPTGVMETGELNGLIARLNKKKNPNRMFADNVKAAFQKFTKDKNYENIVFTALDWHLEDKGTVLAEREYSGLPAKFIPLNSLIVTPDALLDDCGNKIDLLYRLYPVEWFAREEDGVKLLNLAIRGKLDLLNPPSAFIAQSKVMQAVIWELAANTDYFNEKEKEAIKRYFLPTYLDDSYLKGKPYVAKPVYGREGQGVRIYNEKGDLEDYAKHGDYGEHMVYQELVELPKLTVNAWSGEYTGSLLVSGFLVGGKYSGVFLRLGERITGDLAYFVPAVC